MRRPAALQRRSPCRRRNTWHVGERGPMRPPAAHGRIPIPCIRIQLGFMAGVYSLPEPDAAVIPGAIEDYDREHPRAALLVAEVSDSSFKQDRLTKGAIYAAAGIPESWIVNLRDDCVEVRRQPEPEKRRYASIAIARRGERIEPVALPGISIAVSDLLPSPTV